MQHDVFCRSTAMGGRVDEVRGSSKIEAYLAYVDEVESMGDMLPERDPDPRYKKECKSRMVQDPKTGEWILHYRLHT